MSAIDIIESVRPDADPMALVERRMIRERLFGVGHGDVTRNIAARSASGAVVSTAPRGTRAMSANNSHAAGSIVKIVAGLLLLGGLSAAGWAFVARGDDEVVETTPTTVPVSTTAPTTTVAPTTTLAPIVRTGVSIDVPLVLPPNALAVDIVEIQAPAPGSSGLILSAPDGTNLWLAEIDGDVPNLDALEVTPIGAITVGVPRDFEEPSEEGTGIASYQLQAPCGFLLLNDAPARPFFRPEMTALLEATSIDGSGVIDMSLPSGWSVLDVGPSVNTYFAQFQVAAGLGTVPVVLAQSPGGSIAQLAFGGRQLRATEFLGADAFLDSQSLNPNLTSIFWRDENTVFNVRSDQLGFAELEDFIDSLEPVEVSDWETRFDQLTPPAPVLESECAPQPGFGSTLDP